MTPPFLSVVTPTYNREAILRTMILGLTKQSYPADNWELLVVSDGSTDGTDAYLKTIAPTLPFRLRPIFQINGGPAKARNNGIRQADGTVIVFLDDDVEPVESFLARHAQHHCKQHEVAVIGPMLPDALRRDAEPIWIAWEHSMLCRQYDNFNNGVWPSAGPNHFYSGNASIRRELLMAVNGFDETFKRQEDVEMAYRLEKEQGVVYRFDYQAQGIHRPSRSFEGWLKVPYAYGQLDVDRVRDGNERAWLLWSAYHHRSKMTRRCIRQSLQSPALSPIIRQTLLQVAQNLYRMRRDSAAIALMSAVYNIRYMEGVCLNLGLTKLQRLLSLTEERVRALNWEEL